MTNAPLPPNEDERVAALLQYDVLDTDFEAAYDELTELASAIYQVPIALISLTDPDRQWFKSKVGLEAMEIPRDAAFCSHAISQEDIFVVEDALEDDRFADNPFVTSDPHIRFYAGAPLVTPDGHALGTLCVIDLIPRKFSAEQRQTLRVLAKQVMNQMQLRLTCRRLQKYGEQMLEANAAKDKFLYVIAHDLRGPFNTMSGYARLLVDSLDSPGLEEAKEMAEDIGDSCRSTLNLLDDLLEWAMCQAGKIKCRPIEIDLDVLLDELLGLLSGMAKAKGIAVTVAGSEGIQVHADRAMIFSVLQNLLHNAFKFTPREGSVRVELASVDSEALIIVSDTGVGMSEEAVRALFHLEESASTEGTEGEEGTGLGLHLCQQFMDKNGGRIEVSSQPGKGSTFRLALPLALPAPQTRDDHATLAEIG